MDAGYGGLGTPSMPPNAPIYAGIALRKRTMVHVEEDKPTNVHYGAPDSLLYRCRCLKAVVEKSGRRWYSLGNAQSERLQSERPDEDRRFDTYRSSSGRYSPAHEGSNSRSGAYSPSMPTASVYERPPPAQGPESLQPQVPADLSLNQYGGFLGTSLQGLFSMATSTTYVINSLRKLSIYNSVSLVMDEPQAPKYETAEEFKRTDEVVNDGRHKRRHSSSGHTSSKRRKMDEGKKKKFKKDAAALLVNRLSQYMKDGSIGDKVCFLSHCCYCY